MRPRGCEELATVATVLGMDVHDLMPSVPVVGPEPHTGWFPANAQQPRGRIGHGLLGSKDHHHTDHYPPLRAVSPSAATESARERGLYSKGA